MSSWKVTINDKSMLLDELSENDFVEATIAHPDVSWLRLYVSPAAHPGALYDLICACALRLGEPMPDRPRNIKEAVALLAYLDQVEDDLPRAFDEAGLPLENTAAGETETTTSSTSTEPEAGIPTEPEQLPSETETS